MLHLHRMPHRFFTVEDPLRRTREAAELEATEGDRRPHSCAVSMALAALNAELSRHPLEHGINFRISCEGRSFGVSSAAGHLAISASAAAPQSQTPLVELASLGAARARPAAARRRRSGSSRAATSKSTATGASTSCVHFKQRSARSTRRRSSGCTRSAPRCWRRSSLRGCPTATRRAACRRPAARRSRSRAAGTTAGDAARSSAAAARRAHPTSTSARAATARAAPRSPRRTAERTPPLLRRRHACALFALHNRAAPRALYRGGALHDCVARTGGVAGPRRRVARRRVVGAAAAVHAVGGWRPLPPRRRAVRRGGSGVRRPFAEDWRHAPAVSRTLHWQRKRRSGSSATACARATSSTPSRRSAASG